MIYTNADTQISIFAVIFFGIIFGIWILLREKRKKEEYKAREIEKEKRTEK